MCFVCASLFSFAYLTFGYLFLYSSVHLLIYQYIFYCPKFLWSVWQYGWEAVWCEIQSTTIQGHYGWRYLYGRSFVKMFFYHSFVYSLISQTLFFIWHRRLLKFKEVHPFARYFCRLIHFASLILNNLIKRK